MKKKKVAVVYPFFAHYREPIFRKLLNSDKFDFFLIGGRERSKRFKKLKLMEVEDKRFLEVRNYWFLKDFLWQCRLLSQLKKNKFDVVIFLGDWKYSSTLVALFYLKFKRVPTLFWSHGILDRERNLNNFLKYIFLNLFSSGGFLYDHRAQNILREYGYKKPLKVVFNSLDYDLQRDLVKKVKVADDLNIKSIQPYVVLSGRLDGRKNIELLLKSIFILKQRNEKVNLVLIGEGEQTDFLKEQVVALEIIDRVKFVGACYDEGELCKWFIGALASVIPNAVGLSAIHALTYGTPVITNDDIYSHGPEVEAIVDGVTGSFFKKNDPYSLADHIMEFLKMAPHEAHRISKNCILEVRDKYNPKTQALIIEERLIEISNSI